MKGLRYQHADQQQSNVHNTSRGWKNLVTTLLLFCLSFPLFDPSFGTGLDSSYVWGFNFLFDHDYKTLSSLIYPYGPFLWLKYPTIEGCHFSLFLLFYSIVKLFFIWQSLQLTFRSGCPFLVAVFALVPACILGNIDVYIVMDVALLILLYSDSRHFTSFLCATVLAVFALFIKVSIGAQACSVLFVGWLICLLQSKNMKQGITEALTVVSALVIVGFAVYHSFPSLFSAYLGMIHQMSCYSDSLVVMPPDHKAWALVIFALSIAVMVMLLFDKRAKTAILILLIPLFASWKHGIVREDYYHFMQLISFASCFFALVLINMDKKRWVAFGCGFVAISMLLVNNSALRYSSSLQLTTVRPLNFAKTLLNYRHIYSNAVQNSLKALDTRRLDTKLINQIGTHTMDCYPWEQVYIAANGFNWQPHTTYELGAGNSGWLNHKASENYVCDGSFVDYVLLHRTNYAFEDGLQSLDERYLLNDEPEVIDSIFTNYHVTDTGWYGIMLQHGRECLTPTCENTACVITAWNEWVNVPQCGDTVLRAEIQASDNILGQIRNFLYKPDIYYIDYRMPDGCERSYRYSPSTAKCGLWVGPMLESYTDITQFLNGEPIPHQPTAIRLRPKHNSGHKKMVRIRFRKSIITSNKVP